MAEEEESLEIILNAATNPANRDEDWETITKFCEQINKDLEGPQTAVRLLAHKIQSPQEREALYALATLEACVKNCGRRFHVEVGKFRFLNEMIKVVSPKYLGSKTSEKVKKKCIELIYSWSKGLPHENKILEAYQMLKQQGIVKADPDYIDKKIDVFPPPKPRTASFEDEEKSKLLAKLLKSKNPQDLQAANRLIKNMVKQDADKMERVSRRINELEQINNNSKLLMEMLEHYSPETSSAADLDMMKELYDSLERLRPNLFRLASDADDKENDAINDILKSNDEVTQVMAQYKKKVGDKANQNGHASDPASSLLDLADQSAPSHPSTQTKDPSTEILDEELLALGLGDSNTKSESLLGDLDDIFAASSASTVSTHGKSLTTAPVMNNAFTMSGGQPTFQAFNQPIRAPVPTYSISQPMTGNFSQFPPQTSQPTTSLLMSSDSDTSVFSQKPKPPPTEQQTLAMKELDMLGQNLLQQNLPKNLPIKPQNTGQKVPMNQMLSKTASPQLSPGNNLLDNPAPAQLPVSQPSPVSSTPVKQGLQVMALTDVNVPLESIQPESTAPVNAYDKNGLKIVIHLAKNKPREDVTVMVVSTISTNTNPVKNFVFQAAVPKVMKVKLQPPSATDLPAYNPILPPAAITQVMLLANPQKEKVRLKFKISYNVNGENLSDVGEVDNFTVL
ncbi:ADP-ribosylation factor-binding protein GGA1-like [Saccostrea echinata]|uniref:ADP-ribosylation factor-binding protein GGA1-like n=1 Tax=Saccostrea echinata TaxID=191078 RepID=UPI002A829DF3|nr:ADP-ribosylation factor-binding protein GGA1-like [Saccostrea echinata]XP_061196354.1 ADP-ribosylation factor-binding protein GGA1-like [Saccostrea echinata]